MKLGTKVLILGSVASMALAALSGCDRGVASDCVDRDSTCTSVGDIFNPPSIVGTGTGGSGEADPDTATPGIGEPAGAEWDPAYDTGATVKAIAKTEFLGIPSSLAGGESRRIAFYVTDSTLRIKASSDGGNPSTSNRETFYEVRILCTDSIRFGWDSNTDNGLSPKAAWGIDPLSVFEPKPLFLTILEMPVIARSLDAHLTARRGSTFMVWVKARSGYRLAGNAVAIPEDSLPRLNIAQTRALLFSGAALKPIPSDPFTLKIP